MEAPPAAGSGRSSLSKAWERWLCPSRVLRHRGLRSGSCEEQGKGAPGSALRLPIFSPPCAAPDANVETRLRLIRAPRLLHHPVRLVEAALRAHRSGLRQNLRLVAVDDETSPLPFDQLFLPPPPTKRCPG